MNISGCVYSRYTQMNLGEARTKLKAILHEKTVDLQQTQELISSIESKIVRAEVPSFELVIECLKQWMVKDPEGDIRNVVVPFTHWTCVKPDVEKHSDDMMAMIIGEIQRCIPQFDKTHGGLVAVQFDEFSRDEIGEIIGTCGLVISDGVWRINENEVTMDD